MFVVVWRMLKVIGHKSRRKDLVDLVFFQLLLNTLFKYGTPIIVQVIIKIRYHIPTIKYYESNHFNLTYFLEFIYVF